MDDIIVNPPHGGAARQQKGSVSPCGALYRLAPTSLRTLGRPGFYAVSDKGVNHCGEMSRKIRGGESISRNRAYNPVNAIARAYFSRREAVVAAITVASNRAWLTLSGSAD
jgi:hypothetical protein